MVLYNRKEDEQYIAANAEVAGCARNIAKEQERHEMLSSQHTKLRNELSMVQSQLEHSKEKQRNLQMVSD